jgi:hypothetical protein
MKVFWVDKNFPSPALAQEALAKEALTKGILGIIEREVPKDTPVSRPPQAPPAPIAMAPSRSESGSFSTSASLEAPLSFERPSVSLERKKVPEPEPESAVLGATVAVDEEVQHKKCVENVNSACQMLLDGARPKYEIFSVAGQQKFILACPNQKLTLLFRKYIGRFGAKLTIPIDPPLVYEVKPEHIKKVSAKEAVARICFDDELIETLKAHCARVYTAKAKKAKEAAASAPAPVKGKRVSCFALPSPAKKASSSTCQPTSAADSHDAEPAGAPSVSSANSVQVGDVASSSAVLGAVPPVPAESLGAVNSEELIENSLPAQPSVTGGGASFYPSGSVESTAAPVSPSGEPSTSSLTQPVKEPSVPAAAANVNPSHPPRSQIVELEGTY